MNKRLSFMALILICGLVYTTCDLLKDAVKEPEVTLKSVDFTEIDLTGLKLLSTVDVKNNNSIDIPLPKIDWDLQIIDIPFVNGIIQSAGPIKSNASTEVEFPVSFTYENLINVITGLTDDNAKYKINMVVHIPVQGLGELTWPFSHEGKIPIARLPDITVASKPSASLTYGNLIPGLPINTPTGGKIEFSINVKNNSNVAIVVNALSYDLKIGNTSLTGGVDGKPNINKGDTNEIKFSFPLTIENITSIGTSVLTGSNINYSLTGNYKFSLPEFPFLNELGSSFTLQ